MGGKLCCTNDFQANDLGFKQRRPPINFLTLDANPHSSDLKDSYKLMGMSKHHTSANDA